jgi:archaemetzincin
MFLRIVPVGNPIQEILEKVKSDLETNFNIKCRIMSKLPIPTEAFNQWRKQYNAEIVMNSVSKSSEAKFIDKNMPTIMITDIDLYYAGLNFVFGLEDPQKSSAIVSLARLRTEFYDERPNKFVLEERTVKEVLHELGHYLGLDHCSFTRCVMSFSPSVYDVDKKEKNFCERCKLNLITRGINLV